MPSNTPSYVSKIRKKTAYSRQQIADSRQQTADSRQQTGDSRQQTADTRQQTVRITCRARLLSQLSAPGVI
jgi:hypothetical protein